MKPFTLPLDCAQQFHEDCAQEAWQSLSLQTSWGSVLLLSTAPLVTGSQAVSVALAIPAASPRPSAPFQLVSL